MKQKIEQYIVYYNKRLAKAWKWAAIETKDIQTLIHKVMRIEGALNQSAGVA